MSENQTLREPFPGFEIAIQELSKAERDVCERCCGRGWVPKQRAYQRIYRRFQRWTAAKTGKAAEHEGGSA